ncbi:carboxypeptidase-like regulatory domain-containing protein [Saliphagus infecundisoli]|uniref:Carboxypeptidase regulatory-like domain-containing protein n=1 Tax=Saliphagus infecundisoli TaxID=1849069 RepID=A0ABD5QH48_9EURY|nr:carboxypeptidase-like regulatory domain-containing protein [Saliphagus infecundisoli]
MNDTDNEITTDESESTDSEAIAALTVRVVGPAGEPIEGAIVRGEGDGVEFGGETDADGTYVEEEADTSTYTIEVDHGEYEAATVEYTHDDDGEVTVELASPVAVAELSVRVVDSAGEPIAGASVDAEGRPHDAGIPLEFSGETDSEGVYRDTVYENAYAITVDHEEYHPETVEYGHDGDGGPTVSLEPIEGGVPGASRITVAVVDESGSPIEGAEVIGRGTPHEADIPLQFRGETNSNGRHPDVVYHNDYRIQADHPDYTGEIVRHTHDGPADVAVELESGPERIPVAITAIHPDTGGAIEGAAVRLVRTSGPDSVTADAETGSDGAALLEVEAGEYNVLVADDIDLTLVETEYTVAVGDDPVQTSFEAVTEPDDCVLTVEVVDGETGSPIEGARVQADVRAENIDDMGLAAGEADGNGIAEIQGWCGEWEPAIGSEGYWPADPGRLDVAGNDALTVELEPRE